MLQNIPARRGRFRAAAKPRVLISVPRCLPELASHLQDAAVWRRPMAVVLLIERGAWNCAWSTPTVEQYPAAPGLPQHIWVCSRVPDACRLVIDDDCEDCPFWEEGNGSDR
jgi:hypothetical protein